MGVLFRFAIVGVLNSAFGYAIILLGLWAGFGDYIANATGYACGLLFSYALHRQWTFSVNSAVSFREVARFGVAAAIAYSANLSVIAVARSFGHVNNPWVQACAMVAYSATFFVLTRFLVFAQPKPSNGPA